MAVKELFEFGWGRNSEAVATAYDCGGYIALSVIWLSICKDHNL
jgi:hypothetical protein